MKSMESKFLLSVIVALLLFAQSGPVQAEEAVPQTLITNVNVFDGKTEKLVEAQDVLIEGNLIKQIGDSISAPGATVIDGKGRTLMPGLIESHAHLTHMTVPGRSGWLGGRDMGGDRSGDGRGGA